MRETTHPFKIKWCGAPRPLLWGVHLQCSKRHADWPGTGSRSPCRGRRSGHASRLHDLATREYGGAQTVQRLVGGRFERAERSAVRMSLEGQRGPRSLSAHAAHAWGVETAPVETGTRCRRHSCCRSVRSGQRIEPDRWRLGGTVEQARLVLRPSQCALVNCNSPADRR